MASNDAADSLDASDDAMAARHRDRAQGHLREAVARLDRVREPSYRQAEPWLSVRAVATLIDSAIEGLRRGETAMPRGTLTEAHRELAGAVPVLPRGCLGLLTDVPVP